MELMKRLFQFEIIIFLLLGFLLLVFVFAVPPFQKPDEEVHFYRTLSLASGNLYCSKKTGNNLVIEGKFVRMIDEIHRMNLPLHKNNKFNTYLYNTAANTTAIQKDRNYNVDYQCSFPVVSYIPQTLGIIISSLLSLSAVQIFFAGRLSLVFVVFLWMLVLYKKCLKSLRPILLLLYFTPVLLQQVTSYGYDAMNILSALSCFVLVVQYSGNLFLLGITFLLVLITKPGGYEPLVLMLFLIPFQNFTSRKVTYIKKLTILLTSVGSLYFATRLPALLSFGNGGQVLRPDISPLYNVLFLIKNPLSIFTLLLWTSVNRGLFYLESTVGILGWLEYSIGWSGYMIYGFFALCVIAVTRVPDKLVFTKRQVIAVLLFLAAHYCYLLLLYFVIWNKPNAVIIDGIQGRYFLPLVPFGLYTVIQIKQHFLPRQMIPSPHALLMLGVLSMTLVTIIAVFSRYY
jgi:uncharacterized membrane protein